MIAQTKRQSQPVAPVSAVCAAFAAKPSAYPPEAPKPDVTPVYRRTGNSTEAQRSGFGRKRRCSGMDETCRTCGKRRKKPRRAKSRDFGRCGEKAARKQDKAAGACAPRGGHNCPRCGQFWGFARAFQTQRKTAGGRCRMKKARRFKENSGVPMKNTR